MFCYCFDSSLCVSCCTVAQSAKKQNSTKINAYFLYKYSLRDFLKFCVPFNKIGLGITPNLHSGFIHSKKIYICLFLLNKKKYCVFIYSFFDNQERILEIVLRRSLHPIFGILKTSEFGNKYCNYLFLSIFLLILLYILYYLLNNLFLIYIFLALHPTVGINKFLFFSRLSCCEGQVCSRKIFNSYFFD